MSARLEAAVVELVAALREEVAPQVLLDAPDRLLSVDEASDVLGVGRSRLYDEIAAGRLRTLKIGRRRLIPAASVAELIAGRTP